MAEKTPSWVRICNLRFQAKLEERRDGTQNLFRWHVQIPGKKGTQWEGGLYPLTIEFPTDYPATPPHCAFPPGFWHPNVYPDGEVCLSIIDPQYSYAPGITVVQICQGIQELLDTPNPKRS